jgi:iron(III) transport system permease protein
MRSDSLTPWRLALLVVLAALVAVPLAWPLSRLAADRAAWRAWAEPARILLLTSRTLVLVAATLALSLPIGTAGAFLLYRTELPLARFWRFLNVMLLFVPLPLTASAWQAALGPDGWVPLAAWTATSAGDPDVSPTGVAWKPWAHGMAAAVWVHAVAALPWVVWIAGQGFRWVERELEEDALTLARPGRVFWHVTLPRCRATLWAAALWVALQAATEITVTDVMQVRTYAEEVYTQLVVGDSRAVVRAVAVAVPAMVLTGVLVAGTVFRLQRTLPALETLSASPVQFPLGRWRRPLAIAVSAAAGFLAGVPLVSLIRKAGLADSPETWSALTAWGHVVTVLQVHGPMVAQSLVLALGTGALAAGLGVVVCWSALGGRWFFAFVVCLMAVAWAEPAPVVGFGLTDTIQGLMEVTRSPALAKALYYGPSLLPVLWVHLIRFFPFAVAILWPMVRLIPVEIREGARVDGARPGRELLSVALPLALPAVVQAAVAVAVLSLGELSAGKRVETPGSETLAHEIFDKMHYGVTNDLAALCLVLLAAVTAGTAALAVAARHPWVRGRYPLSAPDAGAPAAW